MMLRSSRNIVSGCVHAWDPGKPRSYSLTAAPTAMITHPICASERHKKGEVKDLTYGNTSTATVMAASCPSASGG